jgi:hypothetical protein
VNSSFGQPIAHQIPYAGFQQAALATSKEMLYYEDAVDPTSAAFRYKAVLYEGSADGITARFQNMQTLWTDADRQIALAAAGIIRGVLKYDPFNAGLRNALLDIYYDMAVADLTKATELMVLAQKAALGIITAESVEFLISEEIRLIGGDPPQVGALQLYDYAMRPYFELLKDPMGIDMTRVDPDAAAAAIPFGYYLFQTEVPQRTLFGTSYKDGDNIKPIIDQNGDGQADQLFESYKDLVLLFNMQRSAAAAAAKLARLYAMRGDGGDAESANAVIGEAQQKAYTDGIILHSIFFETSDDLDQIPGLANSGITAARAGWARGLSALSSAKSFLEGDVNPLGFDRDFLALTYTLLPSGGQKFSDSYSFFQNELFRDNGPLETALDKHVAAKDAHKTYQIHLDEMAGELAAIRTECEDRLREIFGIHPGDPDYFTSDPGDGSEIWVQMINIDLARLRIVHNRQEIRNREAQIRHEIERRGQEHNINNLISQTYIRYGEKQAELTIAIGAINAVQAAADAMASAGGDWLTSMGASVAVGAANAAIQAGCETAKGFLEAEKERYAAKENATIHFLNDQIAAAESSARVKDLFLGMSTLAIESTEAAVVLAREFGKLKALWDEKAYLETRWLESDSNLATRYFADPSHRIISNHAIIEAGFAFDTAQYWVYMLARALDYRMNQRFVAPSISEGDIRTYTSQSVFKLRNAEELVHMVQSIDYWATDKSLSDREGQTFVKYSLREDFLGLREGTDESGHPFQYPDPATGELVSPQEAFRSYLKYVAKNGRSDQLTGFDEVVRLEFSTVNTNFGETFFSKGRWNEKIKWLAVKINSEQTYPSEIRIYLAQSGTAFVRNKTRGTVPNPDRPDIVEGEMTGYPVRRWILDGTLNRWTSKQEFGFSSINARITEDPSVPPSAWQNAEFHELSPAVSKWILEIPTRKGGVPVVRLEQVSDIEIWFYNYYIARD